MENLPIDIYIVFALGVIVTLLLLYKATHYSKPVMIITLLWLVLQGAISLSGFYTVTSVVPPRFALLLMPPVVFIIALFFIKRGRWAMDSFDVKILTLLHVVRILVELVLYWLHLYKGIPQVMTFEGRNYDILCGITAPLVWYFGYVKPMLGKKVLLAWNVICLLLLANIVITAVLSAPLPFQRFAFDEPSVALFYFPFVWLPGFIVPTVFFAHLVTIRRLLKAKSN
ncbi:hypothetical protein [Mucilaginibacter sp. SG564]|uniref:hypothetical protein n=1 Tax=Mucilaginibacter sp. SG564 TaxID=2587022 RepID=UPI00155791FE|nr:hypothetical protein [Mucilaginibacter sp. SG564]NOW95197.1 hypothetical protein [Mucilaginibacter sp. SG564]